MYKNEQSALAALASCTLENVSALPFRERCDTGDTGALLSYAEVLWLLPPSTNGAGAKHPLCRPLLGCHVCQTRGHVGAPGSPSAAPPSPFAAT
eukprot:5623244-Alexandrium_andersonii.AAC.1